MKGTWSQLEEGKWRKWRGRNKILQAASIILFL
jgi:hypothetical protein